MPNGGQLTLKAKTVNDKATISVMNTDVWIPADAKPNLFTLLFTIKAKGQGLGLVVVKRLVTALHGT